MQDAQWAHYTRIFVNRLQEPNNITREAKSISKMHGKGPNLGLDLSSDPYKLELVKQSKIKSRKMRNNGFSAGNSCISLPIFSDDKLRPFSIMNCRGIAISREISIDLDFLGY